MSQSYLGHLDSRNTKYQGFIEKSSRNGIGILVDEFVVFCMSHWKNDQPNGPTLIIYPKRQLFYGNVINQRPNGVCCFIPNNQYCVYANFDSNGNAKQIAIRFAADNTVYKAQLVQRQNDQNSLKSLKNLTTEANLTQIYNCQSEQQVLQAIEKAIGKVSPEIQSYLEYLKKNFEENSSQLLQITNNRIGFKDNQTLGAKFQSNVVKSVGMYSKSGKNLQMGRQYTQNRDGSLNIQQGVFKDDQAHCQTVTYTSSQSRPIQATKIFQEFFKKSTTFQNKYIKLSFADDIYRYFSQQVCKSMQNVTYLFAQQILEQCKPKESEQNNRVYSIQEVKRQILSKVQRKNNSMRTSVNAIFQNVSPFTYLDQQTPSKKLQASRSRSRSRSSSRRSTYEQLRGNQKYNYLDQVSNQKQSQYKYLQNQRQQFLGKQYYHKENVRPKQHSPKQRVLSSPYRPKVIVTDRVESYSPLKLAIDPNIIDHFTLNKPQQRNIYSQPYRHTRSQYLIQVNTPFSEFMASQEKRRRYLGQQQLYNLEKQRQILQRQRIVNEQIQQINRMYYQQLNRRKILTPEQQQLNIVGYRGKNVLQRSQGQIDYALKTHNRYTPFISSNRGQRLISKQRRPIFQRQIKVSPSFKRDRNPVERSKSPIAPKYQNRSKPQEYEKLNRMISPIENLCVSVSPIKRRYKYME